MSEFIIRTEDIRQEDIFDLFVEGTTDRQIIDKLKTQTPVILEGSRGTGKSFLLRICEEEQNKLFTANRIVPIYITFVRSSLLQSGDQSQFIHWMLAKICSQIIRTLRKKGLNLDSSPAISILSGQPNLTSTTKIEALTKQYEESYKRPSELIDIRDLPTIENFKDAIEDICKDLNIVRFNFLFDEVAHILRPEQQRQFFTLFRDLRSPYITCNAAVYPGVTSYGETFQSSHDADQISLIRRPTDAGYLNYMKNIVFKQSTDQQKEVITRNIENFNALSYCASGNPRLLLKILSKTPRLSPRDTSAAIKSYFREDIWADHSLLAEKYVGHRIFIDWGRDFVENDVIKKTNDKNSNWALEKKTERTCYFWVHRDAPEAVKEALRMLAYTGIVIKLDHGIVATRGNYGTRYSINLGCLVIDASNPQQAVLDLVPNLSIKRTTEYGHTDPGFQKLASEVGDSIEPDTNLALGERLERSINELDLSEFQISALTSINLTTIGKVLRASERDFQQADYIGPKRSRKIMNIAVASILEYLSG